MFAGTFQFAKGVPGGQKTKQETVYFVYVEKKYTNLKFELEFAEDCGGFFGYYRNGGYTEYVFEDLKRKPELLNDFKYIRIQDYL